ncbi:MAG TPA: hypothetical protein VF610_03865 [Segetibacter sp.]
MPQQLQSHKPVLLVFPFNVMAHYLRCIQLAKYLQPYFHIQFLHSDQYNAFVAQAGYGTFACATLNAEKVQQCVASFDFTWLNENDLTYLYNAQVKIINELGASAVLGDMSPTLKMAAEKTGVFHLSLLNGYLSSYYQYVRRVPRSFHLYKFVNALPKTLANYFTTMGEQISFHDIHRPFSKIRKRAGLTAKYSYLQELEGDVVLLCDLPDIFPQKDLPSNYYFIPPLYYQNEDGNNELIKNIDPSKKTLYVSMGSTGNWNNISFLNNSDYYHYNIITAGDRNNIIRGSNVFSYSFVNNAKLFNITDLVICHGGNGTTYQALSYGIPVLCKTTHLEQEYNVDGLQRLQLGKSLNDFKDDQEYMEVTRQWVERKGSLQFNTIKDKIAGSTEGFSQIMAEIMQKEYLHKKGVLLVEALP